MTGDHTLRVLIGITEVVVLMAWPARTIAQEAAGAITGVVVDARTRQPLPGAVVQVKSPPQSAATNVDGRFRLETVPIGTRELIVSLVGFTLEKYVVEVPPEGVDVTIPLTEGTAAYNESVTVHGDVFGTREVGVAGQQSLNSEIGRAHV